MFPNSRLACGRSMCVELSDSDAQMVRGLTLEVGSARDVLSRYMTYSDDASKTGNFIRA